MPRAALLWDRLQEFVRSPIYRKVLLARALLSLLNRWFPQLDSFAIADGGHSGTVHYSSRDRCISLYAMAMGNFHGQELQTCLDLMTREGLSGRGIFMEVGANIGSTTVAAARQARFSQVIAFEPVPKNIELLRLNVFGATKPDRVRLESLAVGSREDKVEMALSNSNHGDNRLISSQPVRGSQLYGERSWTDRIVVEMTSLDRYCEVHAVDVADIGLIWLDVQGFEGGVFEGAQQLLAQRCVPICLEFWPYGLRRAGGLETVLQTVEVAFRYFYRLDQGSRHPVSEMKALVDQLPRPDHHYDLLLIP